MHLRTLPKLSWVLLAVLLLSGLSGDGAPRPDSGLSTPARLEELEAENARLRASLDRLDDLQVELSTLRAEVEHLGGRPALAPLHVLTVPDSVRFCGERLPLEHGDVYRRFEAEWNRFLVNRHWLVEWMRRSRDSFPYVETRLAEAGLPDDLKYVMVIESAADPRATSSAGAAGYWQFIRSTGRRYGLERTTDIDDRRDLARATDAAIAYLRDLHAEFGSWPLTLAAYNAGERRIRDAIHEQGTSDFYQMVLPRETEAYWFKAAATRVLFQDPQAYGIHLPDDGWRPVACDTLELKIRRDTVDFTELAAAAGLGYRELKELNPRFRNAWLPRGTHRLVVPREAVERLLEAFTRGSIVAEAAVPQGASGAARGGEE